MTGVDTTLSAFSRKLPKLPEFNLFQKEIHPGDPWNYGEMEFFEQMPNVSPRTLRKQRRLANRAKRKSKKGRK